MKCVSAEVTNQESKEENKPGWIVNYLHSFFTLCFITYRNDVWISRSYFVSLRNRLTLYELCSRKIEGHANIYKNIEFTVLEFYFLSLGITRYDITPPYRIFKRIN